MIPVLGLVLAVTLAQTPTPQPAAPTARLAGRVTVEGTNAPLAEARVTLIPAGRPMTQPPLRPLAFGPPPQTTTDQEGRFAFSRLRPGEYHIDVQRTGYAPLEDPGRGRTIQLAEGQSIDNLQLQLQKGAVISGRILAQSGEPAPDVRVIALRRISGQGTAARLMPNGMQGMQQTNDLGEFRIAGLAPGEYYVSAGPQMQFGAPGAAAPAGTARTTIATTFYPGTTDQSAAQPIAVARGAEVGNISFMLLSLPAFRVSGVVVDEDGQPVAGAMVMLMSDPRNGSFMGPIGNVRSGDDGRFTIDRVVSGTYRTSASVPVMMGGGGSGGITWSSGRGAVGRGGRSDQPAEVVVADSNVTGVRIVVHKPQ
jgi:protocatechuate 3,4-dioxygenase beta subunit